MKQQNKWQRIETLLEQIIRKKMINFQNGACIDTRTEKQKEKDYNLNEIVASVDVVDWKEKSGTDWRSFPVQKSRVHQVLVLWQQ